MFSHIWAVGQSQAAGRFVSSNSPDGGTGTKLLSTIVGLLPKKSGDEQGVAITGRYRTGPPCSVGRPIPTPPVAGEPTVHAPGGRPARTPAALQTTATDASQQNYTGLLGGPVIKKGRMNECSKTRFNCQDWLVL